MSPVAPPADLANVRYDVEGPVAVITLNRPDRRNSLTPSMMSDIETALERADVDPGVKVVLFKAAGPAFCSGYDMDIAPKAGDGDAPDPAPAIDPSARSFLHLKMYASRRSGSWWLKALWDLRKPTIAQVSGYCLAGGNDLVLCCDLAYADEDAQFGMPQVRAQGLIHAHALLPLLVGMRRAKELSFTGDSISGREAESLGLVNRAMPAADLDAEVRRIAERIALAPSEMLMSSKWGVNRVYETMGLDAMIRTSNEYNAIGGLNDRSDDFFRLVLTKGMRAALADRDGPYREQAADG